MSYGIGEGGRKTDLSDICESRNIIFFENKNEFIANIFFFFLNGRNRRYTTAVVGDYCRSPRHSLVQRRLTEDDV